MIDFTPTLCLSLPVVLGVVQALEEEQVGELLDGIHWVGETTSPELIPELIDLRAEFGIGEQCNSYDGIDERRYTARVSVKPKISAICS